MPSASDSRLRPDIRQQRRLATELGHSNVGFAVPTVRLVEHRVSLFRASLAISLLLVAIVGCADAPREPGSDGPMDFGGEATESGTLCMPSVKSPDISHAEVLGNSGAVPIYIDSVTLMEPDGLELVEAVLVQPGPHRPNLGLDRQWPPPNDLLALTGVKWTQRRAAVGASIESTPDLQRLRWNLVLHLRQIGEAGSDFGFLAVRIDYSVGDERFYDRSSVRVISRDRC